MVPCSHRRDRRLVVIVDAAAAERATSDPVAPIFATVLSVVAAILAPVPPALNPVDSNRGGAYDGSGPGDWRADHSSASGAGWP